MKILAFNYEYPPLGGGGGVIFEKVCQGWADLGHDVDVITSRYNEPKWEIRGRIHIHRVLTLGRTDPNTANMISMLSYIIFATLKGLRLGKYDFVYTYFALPTGPAGYLVARILKIPNLLNLVGGDIYDPTKKSSPHRHWYYRHVVRFLINKAHSVTAISEDTKNNFIKYYKL